MKEYVGASNTPEVSPGDQSNAADGQPQTRPGQRRHGRNNGGHAGRRADGDGQHVINQESNGRDETWNRAEVVFRHDVCTATLWVGVDGLPIRQDDDDQERGDKKR
jgi:hypothetical protein